MGKQLGTYLREQRKLAGLSVTKLATDSGVSRPMVNYIEAGSREPSVALLARVASTIGIKDMSELFRVYVTEQAHVALAELGENPGKELLSRWLANPGELYPELKARIRSLVALMEALSVKVGELEAAVEGQVVAGKQDVTEGVEDTGNEPS